MSNLNESLIKDFRDFKASISDSIKQKDSALESFKLQIAALESNKTKLLADLTLMTDKFQRADIRLKRAFGEIIALKGRIEKMKTTSFQRMQVKLCTRCHKEYNEKENYNWSCRTHQSTYGGTMWWCCGRRNKDDPGCKYAKHQITENEEETAIMMVGGGY